HYGASDLPIGFLGRPICALYREAPQTACAARPYFLSPSIFHQGCRVSYHRLRSVRGTSISIVRHGPGPSSPLEFPWRSRWLRAQLFGPVFPVLLTASALYRRICLFSRTSQPVRAGHPRGSATADYRLV